LSDDFSGRKFGVQWSLFDSKPEEMRRVNYEARGLRLAAKGSSPADSSPLTCLAGDRSYVAEVTVDLEGDAEGGLLLFYNPKAFVGIGLSRRDRVLKTYLSAEDQTWMHVPMQASGLRIRVTNQENVVTYHYSVDDGKTWQLHSLRMEVSGIHHNVFGGFMSLRIGIYSAGEGSVVIRDFTYRAIA
jgi:xylan 1,4-beta-xylosidase